MYREKSIDYMKGWLTLLMVLSHIVKNVAHGSLFTDFVNLTTFSAFLFCFGFITYKVYLSKDIIPKTKILKGFIKIVIVYYLSAILYLLLRDRDFSINNLLDYMLLKKLAGYSEFLITWSYLYLLILLFGAIIAKILVDKKFFSIAFISSLLFTWIPYEHLTIPWFGPLFGYVNGCFPLLQYFSHYLVGAYLAKEKIVFKKNIFFLSIFCTGTLIIYIQMYGVYPTSRNPHLLWVIGSAFFIYGYYILANRLQYWHFPKFKSILSHVGNHTLVYLLVSNGVIFSLKYFNINVSNFTTHYFIKLLAIVVIYLLTLLGSYFLSELIKISCRNFRRY